MTERGRPRISRAFVGSLLGLAAGLLAMPIMMDPFAVCFWPGLGLVIGAGVGFVRDASTPRREAAKKTATLSEPQ
jgi:hypothetical protein